jgi:hypothetical protein
LVSFLWMGQMKPVFEAGGSHICLNLYNSSLSSKKAWISICGIILSSPGDLFCLFLDYLVYFFWYWRLHEFVSITICSFIIYLIRAGYFKTLCCLSFPTDTNHSNISLETLQARICLETPNLKA